MKIDEISQQIMTDVEFHVITDYFFKEFRGFRIVRVFGNEGSFKNNVMTKRLPNAIKTNLGTTT